tara:strand:- start:409 stop:597 length:189 start_codon:yes stop_codon:yes gene_type:complete
MKLQSKDDIIYRLMTALKRENSFATNNYDYDKNVDYLLHINTGWIEALEWVLNITTGEKDNG